jgi:hypothetical protein
VRLAGLAAFASSLVLSGCVVGVQGGANVARGLRGDVGAGFALGGGAGGAIPDVGSVGIDFVNHYAFALDDGDPTLVQDFHLAWHGRMGDWSPRAGLGVGTTPPRGDGILDPLAVATIGLAHVIHRGAGSLILAGADVTLGWAWASERANGTDWTLIAAFTMSIEHWPASAATDPPRVPE